MYLELEIGKILGKTWQLAGRADQVVESGSYFTAAIAYEAIVIVRDGDGLRGYHNICLHRAGPVAYGCGTRQTMQCRYHRWTYNFEAS